MVISDFRALAEPADFTVLAIRLIFNSIPVKLQITIENQGIIGFWPSNSAVFEYRQN
jgi:hypothetical protein